MIAAYVGSNDVAEVTRPTSTSMELNCLGQHQAVKRKHRAQLAQLTKQESYRSSSCARSFPSLVPCSSLQEEPRPSLSRKAMAKPAMQVHGSRERYSRRSTQWEGHCLSTPSCLFNRDILLHMHRTSCSNPPTRPELLALQHGPKTQTRPAPSGCGRAPVVFQRDDRSMHETPSVAKGLLLDAHGSLWPMLLGAADGEAELAGPDWPNGEFWRF